MSSRTLARALSAIAVLIAVAGCGSTGNGPPSLSEQAPTNTPGVASTAATVDATPGGTVDTSNFADITLKGHGSKVAKLKIPETAVAIAIISHKGSSNFIVDTLDSSGASIENLVNEIGNYSGTRLVGLEDARPVAFKIDADGSWTITVRPITKAPTWNRSKALKGKGDSVYLISPPGGSELTTISFTNKGDSNFIVEAYSPDGGTNLVNEIGNYSGETTLPDGAVILEVESVSGSWTAASSG